MKKRVFISRWAGFSSIVVLAVMGILAVALPVTTNLVQQKQETRSSAAGQTSPLGKRGDYCDNTYQCESSLMCTNRVCIKKGEDCLWDEYGYTGYQKILKKGEYFCYGNRSVGCSVPASNGGNEGQLKVEVCDNSKGCNSDTGKCNTSVTYNRSRGDSCNGSGQAQCASGLVCTSDVCANKNTDCVYGVLHLPVAVGKSFCDANRSRTCKTVNSSNQSNSTWENLTCGDSSQHCVLSTGLCSGACGYGKGAPCCGGGVCNVSNLACSNYSNSTYNNKCLLKDNEACSSDTDCASALCRKSKSSPNNKVCIPWNSSCDSGYKQGGECTTSSCDPSHGLLVFNVSGVIRAYNCVASGTGTTTPPGGTGGDLGTEGKQCRTPSSSNGYTFCDTGLICNGYADPDICVKSVTVYEKNTCDKSTGNWNCKSTTYNYDNLGKLGLGADASKFTDSDSCVNASGCNQSSGGGGDNGGSLPGTGGACGTNGECINTGSTVLYNGNACTIKADDKTIAGTIKQGLCDGTKYVRCCQVTDTCTNTTVGTVKCEGNVSKQCIKSSQSSNVQGWSNKTTCSYKCTDGVGCQDKKCESNTARCSGDGKTVYVCSADGLIETPTTCGDNEHCDSAAKKCVADTKNCTTKKVCVNGTSVIADCNSNGYGWTNEQTCDFGCQSDSVNGAKCNTCEIGKKDCSIGDDKETYYAKTCGSTGEWSEKTECPVECDSSTNWCNGLDKGYLSFNYVLDGVKPGNDSCTKNWKIKVVVSKGTVKTQTYTVPLAKDSTRSANSGDNVYRAFVPISDLPDTTGLSVLLKGPKHMTTKYGMDNQDDGYTQYMGMLTIAKGVATKNKPFNFINYPILAGDVTGIFNGIPDGVIDSLDYNFIKRKMSEVNDQEFIGEEGLDLMGDLDGNCVVNSADLNLLKKALKRQYAQTY